MPLQVEGTVQIEEVAGMGASTIQVIDERIYSWNAAQHGSFPPKACFRYTLPATYFDSEAGTHYPLPPTFSEEMRGIPGFLVHVVYAIVVKMTLLRGAATLWRGESQCVAAPPISHEIYRLNAWLRGFFSLA